MPESRVAAPDALADGEMRAVTVHDVPVLLARVDGRYYATGARCTHYGAPLADGSLSGRLVICPWHHAVFDVTSGALEEPPALDALPSYAVRVTDEGVYVTVPDDAEPTPEGATYRQSGGRAPDGDDAPEDGRTFVVVGGGAAGQAAVEALRAEGFAGRLVLVTQEAERPYDRTQLSKGYLGGQAGDEALPLRDAAFFERLGIEVWNGRTVQALDAEARTITFEDGETLAYDAALVATGGVPRQIDVPGADLEGVHLLRSADDARAIVRAAKAGQRAVVVGGSFIGMEVAAGLAGRGLAVHVVAKEAAPFSNVLGDDVGRVFQALHEEQGTAFHLETSLQSVQAAADGLRVTLESGASLDADMVVLGVGVRPATGFVSGAERADDGGIVADERLRAAEALWVAGDIAEFPYEGERVRIEHWRLAQQHGRIAARNMLGQGVPFRAVPFFWSGQHGVSIRYLGHAADWDDVHVDGSLGDRDFVAYYLAGDAVAAAAGVGRDRAMTALHALWLAGRRPSAARVRAGFDPVAELGG